MDIQDRITNEIDYGCRNNYPSHVIAKNICRAIKVGPFRKPGDSVPLILPDEKIEYFGELYREQAKQNDILMVCGRLVFFEEFVRSKLSLERLHARDREHKLLSDWKGLGRALSAVMIGVGFGMTIDFLTTKLAWWIG
jgi:hypothetical protein